MDFDLSTEQRDIKMAVRQFVEAEFDKDYMLDLELNHKYPWELMKKASKLGYICIDYPEEYGGGGYGLMEKALVQEEFCRIGAGIGKAVGTSHFASKVILRSGSAEQKKKYLPVICSGEGLPFSGGFTEPDHGSDLVTEPLSTTAAHDKEGYIINGTKTFITFADVAAYMVVLCQTDLASKPPYKGHSLFLVEKPSENKAIHISNFMKMGWKTCATTEISFAGVRVPKENMIGELNRGFYCVVGFLDEFRVEVGAVAVGMAQGAFEIALNYSKKRVAFGQKIGMFQAISHKLAEMATKIESARFLVYRAATEFDKHGHIDPAVSSMAKWYPARMAVEVTDEAIQILGGHGYMLENEVERFYRDARVLELVEGTREIHKNTIARALLGKL